jgi:ribosome biogenesis GTPase A
VPEISPRDWTGENLTRMRPLKDKTSQNAHRSRVSVWKDAMLSLSSTCSMGMLLVFIFAPVCAHEHKSEKRLNPVRMMFIGACGVGKSTTITAILKSNKAYSGPFPTVQGGMLCSRTQSQSFEVEVKRTELVPDGEIHYTQSFRLWDTPGFPHDDNTEVRWLEKCFEPSSVSLDFDSSNAEQSNYFAGRWSNGLSLSAVC